MLNYWSIIIEFSSFDLYEKLIWCTENPADLDKLPESIWVWYKEVQPNRWVSTGHSETSAAGGTGAFHLNRFKISDGCEQIKLNHVKELDEAH